MLRAGDVVLTENLTDHGVIGLANILGFSLKGLPTDEEGIRPDAFDAACRAGGVRALVLIPTLNNPTSRLNSHRVHPVASHPTEISSGYEA